MAKNKDKDFVIHVGGDALMAQAINTREGFVITAKSPDSAVDQAKIPLVDSTEDGEEDGWQNWGSGNSWPTDVRQKIEKSTVAAPLIYKAVCSMFGSGVKYYFVEIDNGKIKKVFKEEADIELFFNTNYIDYIALERLMDFKYYNNIFQEFIFNTKFDQIVETSHLEAEYCRVSVQDEKTHRQKYVGMLGDWNNYSKDKVAKIPLAYIKRDSVSEIKTLAQKEKKFAIHSMFPSPGRPIYGITPHHALFRNDGWLAYSNKIPEVLNAMMDNSMRIKWHIKVPSDYWPKAFKGWEQLSQKEQTNKKIEKMTEWNDFLSGTANAAKSFMSEFAVDPATKKPMPGWEFVQLEDKTNLDKEILSSQESDSHIARALNIDPSLAGLQPQGGKMGAGSGSDKRVSFLNGISMSHAEELIILDFLYVVKKINGWPSNVRFAFQHDVPTTLDDNKSGTETTI